jgi:hypothetical protein
MSTPPSLRYLFILVPPPTPNLQVFDFRAETGRAVKVPYISEVSSLLTRRVKTKALLLLVVGTLLSALCMAAGAALRYGQQVQLKTKQKQGTENYQDLTDQCPSPMPTAHARHTDPELLKDYLAIAHLHQATISGKV